MADKSHADLLTELQALTEEVERLKGALERIASKTCGCISSSDPGWHHETCWKFIALAALSPSPAQQEEK